MEVTPTPVNPFTECSTMNATAIARANADAAEQDYLEGHHDDLGEAFESFAINARYQATERGIDPDLVGRIYARLWTKAEKAHAASRKDDRECHYLDAYDARQERNW